MEDAELRGYVATYSAEQREDEVVWFYRHAEEIQPKVVMEIGTKEGGNLKILSTLLPEDGLAIGVDPLAELSDPTAGLPWAPEAQCSVGFVKGRSLVPEVVEQVKEILAGRQIDVLFIDGDHSYEGMLGDFRTYGPMVRSGGIIAVHDIFYLEDVARAWEDIPGDKLESPRNQSSIGIGFIVKE